MASSNIQDGDLTIRGALNVTGVANLAAGSLSGTALNTSVPAPANAVAHAHRRIYTTGSATTVVSATQVIHVCVGATGTVKTVEAGCVVPAIGTDTATVDVKKNGSTILSSTISLTSAQSARQMVAGTISVAALVAGDVLEVIVTPTHSTGTLATGVFAVVDIWESAV